MKVVCVGYARQRKEAKIVFPGGVVHVTTGLRDEHGKNVVHVSVTADGDRRVGEQSWWASWRIIQTDTRLP
jgi:hypothetical protein